MSSPGIQAGAADAAACGATGAMSAAWTGVAVSEKAASKAGAAVSFVKDGMVRFPPNGSRPHHGARLSIRHR